MSKVIIPVKIKGNEVGGIKINEPALDLGICLSIVSSYKNIPIDRKTAVIGEVGLTRRN